MRFSIPSPCSENWNNMIPDENGRFCNSCQKTVTDFSKFSDEQLLAFFAKKEKTENVCGRMRPDQLNRKLYVSKPVPNFYNRWFALALGFFTMIKTSSSQNGFKRDDSGLPLTNKEPQLNIRGTIKTRGTYDPNIISGIVTDAESNEPLASVIVQIEGTQTAAFTGINGVFKLSRNKNEKTENIVLIVRSIGYKTKKVEFTPENSLSVIYLKAEEIKLKEVVVTDSFIPLLARPDIVVHTIERGTISGGVYYHEDTGEVKRGSKFKTFFYKIFHRRKWKELTKKETD